MSKPIQEVQPCPWCKAVPQRRFGGLGMETEENSYHVVPHKKDCFLFEYFGQVLSRHKYKKWNNRPKTVTLNDLLPAILSYNGNNKKGANQIGLAVLYVINQHPKDGK